MTFRTPYLALAGAAALLLAGSVAAQEKAEPKTEKKVEKKIVVIEGEGEGEGEERDHVRLFERLADSDLLDCHEEDGKKVCVARMPFHGRLAGTFLGVELTESTPELREHLGGPRDAGVLISRVEEDSPAAQAGIQVGDIVTSVDGEEVSSAMDLKHAIASREAGAAVAIELYRDGRAEQVTATLGKRDPQMFAKRLIGSHFDAEELAEQVHQALEGIDFEELNANLRKQLDAVDWDEIRETVREALDQALDKLPSEQEKK